MRTAPEHWTHSEEAAVFWRRLHAAKRSVLILDYDGTLAPFAEDRSHARMYEGMEPRLTSLAGLDAVRLVVVSGRPISGLAPLLGGAVGIELWGTHGWERRKLHGVYECEKLNGLETALLEEVRLKVGERGFAETLDCKPAALAIHWRAFEEPKRREIRSIVEAIYRGSSDAGSLRLAPFDGGIELRSIKRNKGTAVRQILDEESVNVPAAYLGDDLTDEDAFSAIQGRGLGILVRPAPRETTARFWLRPPDELIAFLDRWIEHAREAAPIASEQKPDGS